ncbi:MAG: hypothetical protein IJ428_00765 [Clostridia bacterium]|nr:hypothetical protein [Clostridia bacterium]
MKPARSLSLIILAALLLTSCSSNTAKERLSSDTADTFLETDTYASESPNIPNDLRYDGTDFRILSTAGDYLGKNLNEFDIENNADALSQALYDRLLSVEDRFGITFDIQYNASNEIAGLARQSINAASDDYEMVWGVSNYVQSTVYEGLYMSVADLPYVDLDKPWWNRSYIESVSVNAGDPCILFGPINYNALERSVCTFFNIDMMKNVKGLSEQDIYDIVLDGDWTLDKLSELCKDVYNDENGNTLRDAEDTYGFIHVGYWQIDYMAYAAGLNFTERDEDGYPVLALNNERSIALVEKLLAIFNDTESVFNSSNNDEHVTMFGQGQSLFLVNRFYICSWAHIREANVNYGIIPAPKLDSTVENYYSPVERLVQWGMVPKTVIDPGMVSAVTEYMAYEGYKRVMPAYYETTLKFKYTRGDLDGASQMLDIITENQYTDFMGANVLGGMEKIFTNVVRSGQNIFSSTYASLEQTANSYIQNYISTLNE